MANKKGNKLIKHPEKLRLQAMTLWATGKSMREIGEIMGISERSVHNWKYKDQPEPWDAFKKKLRKEMTEKLAQETLEDITTVKARQQRVARAVSASMGRNLINKADAGTLDSEVALDAFSRAIEVEQKLYLPLETSHAPARGAIAIGAKAEGENASVSLLAYMETEYQKARGELNKGEE